MMGLRRLERVFFKPNYYSLLLADQHKKKPPDEGGQKGEWQLLLIRLLLYSLDKDPFLMFQERQHL